MANYSIIQKSQLEGAWRLDAEYYQPEYLNLISKLKSQKSKSLESLTRGVICGPFGSAILQDDYREEGVPLIRVADLSEWFVRDDNLVFIEESLSQKMRRYQVTSRDLVVSQRGTIAMFSKVTDKFPRWNISANLISIKKSDQIDFDYLLAFLNSTYGINQLYRRLSGQVQPKITTDDVKQILIFVPAQKEQKEIASFIRTAWQEIEKSKSLYSQTENLLLEELGLEDFEVEEDFSYIINLSDIKSSHRADAKYFQPEYTKIERKLVKNFKAKKIKDLDFIKVTTGQYCEEYVFQTEGYPYIRGTDISMGTIEIGKLVYIAPEQQILPKKAKEGDVVVTRVGTIGISARLPKEVESGTISDNLIRLRFPEEKLNSYYVTLFFNTIGSQLMIRESRGSVQPRLNQETLKEIVLPILPKPTQQKIADLVQKSHKARKRAKELLEEAKQKVEELLINNLNI